MSVTWNGDALLRRIEAACIGGIDETTAACVPEGQAEVHVDTGLLQSKITSVPAEVRGDQVVGAYGVVDDPGYAIPQEYLRAPRGKSYIRVVADRHFPTVGERIAKRLGQ
jgi:hypothetical protein